MNKQKKLKILFICKWFPHPNNPYQGIFIQQYAKAFAQFADIAVIFATEIKNKSIHENYLNYSIEHNYQIIRVYYKNQCRIPLLSKFFAAINYTKALFKAFKTFKNNKAFFPDIVHVHVLSRTSILAVYLKFLYSIPYIVTEHWTGYLPQDGRYKGFFKKLLTEFAVKKAAAITTVSENLMKNMLSHHLNNKYYVIGNIIQKPKLIKQNFSNEKIKLINISDCFDAMKNISGIINIMPSLINSNHNVELHIIGEGEDKSKLIEKAKELKVYNSHVFFHEPMPHETLMEFIPACDILIVNSRYETFSVVAAEALACGVPIIATRCGGPEFFIDETNGILIEVDNQNALLNAVKTMINNYSKYNHAEISKNILQKFGEDSIVRQFKDIYYLVALQKLNK